MLETVRGSRASSSRENITHRSHTLPLGRRLSGRGTWLRHFSRRAQHCIRIPPPGSLVPQPSQTRPSVVLIRPPPQLSCITLRAICSPNINTPTSFHPILLRNRKARHFHLNLSATPAISSLSLFPQGRPRQLCPTPKLSSSSAEWTRVPTTPESSSVPES
jgi:hypothetical protein